MRFRAEHLFTRSLPADRPRAPAERPAGSLGFPGGRHLQGESSPRLCPHPSPSSRPPCPGTPVPLGRLFRACVEGGAGRAFRVRGVQESGPPLCGTGKGIPGDAGTCWKVPM